MRGDAALHQAYWDEGYKRGYLKGLEDVEAKVADYASGRGAAALKLDECGRMKREAEIFSDILHRIRALKPTNEGKT